MTKQFRIGLLTILAVLALAAAKTGVHYVGLEFLSVSSLLTTGIAGTTFILGFLLAGVISDFKEAEKIPAELRSSLESIWDKATQFSRVKKEFDLQRLKRTLAEIVRDFISGVGHEGGHCRLEPCLASVKGLSESFAEMERLGMPPNYIVRLEGEQAALRRNVLRVLYIQRTQFLPSAHVLAESLAFGIVGLLMFVKTEGSPETMLLFGFISYLFLYVRQLIRSIETPFRQGHGTVDDVSLFLLRRFEESLAE